MSVQSARVQEIVKGDDVTMSHQIMKDVAFAAEQSRAPVELAAGDVATAFYQLQDPTMNDLIGYPCVPVGSFPTSNVTVDIPGVIAAIGNTPARGSQTFQSGLGKTVRIEIVRDTTNKKETYYLIDEVDVFERGFPSSLEDTSGGVTPPSPALNLT